MISSKNLGLIFFPFLLISCNQNELKLQEDTTAREIDKTANLLESAAPVNTQSFINYTSAGTQGEKLNPEHGMPGHRCDIPVGAPLNANSSDFQFAEGDGEHINLTQLTNNPKLNPEHGMPGHRCDIPVGAPLDSKPVEKAETQQIIATPQASTPIKPEGPKPKNNPEHGQPWHRCDIPVGAPLDSKPAEKAEVQNMTTSPQASVPAKPEGPKPKNNPEHGQPWHRCDIAVGAPLDSKPEEETITIQPEETDIQNIELEPVQIPGIE